MDRYVEYTKFLKGLKLRHFRPNEITSYAHRAVGGISNSLPPEIIWNNIVQTLWIADQLRESLKVPITLTSIYRSPEYNRAVGGARASFHMENKAIDLQSSQASPQKIFNRLVKFRDAGVFRGGLGKYNTFVHIDTRGRNATW